MTQEEVRTHPVFHKLTEKQQAFVSALIETQRDVVAAAHKAWDCKDDESARTLGNRALRTPNVAYLAEAYFGVDPERAQFTRDQALEFAAQRARISEDEKVALDYFKLVIAMNGWMVKPADNNPTPPGSVWDEVARLENDSRTTSSGTQAV